MVYGRLCARHGPGGPGGNKPGLANLIFTLSTLHLFAAIYCGYMTMSVGKGWKE